MVRLTHMKWNGIVSQSGVSSIAVRLSTAKTTQRASIRLSCSQAVTHIANGLDRGLRSQLAPEPANRYIHHVGARVEVVTPHMGEELLAAHHLARALEQEVQQPELAVGELAHPPLDPSLAARQVEQQAAGVEHVAVGARGLPPPELHPHAREQLVE